MKWKKNYKIWIKNKNLPIYIKEKLKQMTTDELKISFSNDIEFGSSGIRAPIGYGCAFFNVINIRRVAMAYAKFLIQNYSENELKKRGIIIAHDNRKSSEKFSLEIISIFNDYNIKTIIFKSNKSVPTPIISYSIKELKLIGGFIIAASHNSFNYNGLKLFDYNGCEYLPSKTDVISDIYSNNTTEAINFYTVNTHVHLIKSINKKIEDKYISEVLKIQILPNEPKKIKIVFSNLHGTCKDITPIILNLAKYEKIYVVKEQCDMNEKFLTCPIPNPELKENYKLATKYAKNNSADLIILNDPDGSRIGVSILHNNKYHVIHANELAPILLTYICENKNKNILKNAIVYKSLISSNLFDLVAKSYNIKIKNTLVGFKWISNEIIKNKNKNNLFAFEESNSFKVSNIVNEKDAIQTSLLVAEAVNYYKHQKKTFIDVLDELYKKFGYFYCKTISKEFNELNKNNFISRIMDVLRYNKIDSLGDLKIINKEDYINSLNGYLSENLIFFHFEDGSWLAIRPSGTEPKIKFYFVFVNSENMKFAKNQMELVKNDLFKNHLNI